MGHTPHNTNGQTLHHATVCTRHVPVNGGVGLGESEGECEFRVPLALLATLPDVQHQPAPACTTISAPSTSARR